MTEVNINLKLLREDLDESIARNAKRAEFLKRDMEKFVNALEKLAKKMRGKSSFYPNRV